jgi:putative iron-dependent peroxidase
MVRRSMPWGDLRNHGLQFIAFVADLDVIDTVLRRMCGLSDGQPDALLEYTKAETGGYYYCPPLIDGRLNLVGLS